MAKVNPFRPTSPVNPGMFVGRLPELERLESHLFQTRAGNPSNFMVTGERGIGKSSLLNYIKAVAMGEISSIEEETTKFLVVDIDIDQNTSQLGLVKKIELGLRKGLSQTETARHFLSEAWGFLQRFEAGGVKLNPDSTDNRDETILEEFSYSLAETCNRICGGQSESTSFGAKYDGVLVLVDEADNGSKSLGLGSFFKLVTERLQRRGCEHVMVGLAGLPTLRDVLFSSHPSSLRIFEENILDRLTDKEVGRVIDTCMRHATDHKVTDNGTSELINLSEGYPHFIQQFGYSAFAVDSDNLIDQQDVLVGAFGPRGALDVIGDRYYRDDFYNRIQKESYRQVLRIMADKLDAWVTKQEIRGKFKGNDSTLDNAIKALRDRHIILSREGERGICSAPLK
jgi:Cdc6-like AAA superfamily ATPase